MNALADLDDAFAAAGERVPTKTLPQPWLHNGYYTLTYPCGTHKTLRIHTQQAGKFAGRRIISLLIGPDNTNDYEQVGEITPMGVWMWQRWRGKKPEEYAKLVFDLMKGEKIEGFEVQESRRCLRCNRPLTTPESLAAGVGPECQKRG